MRFILIALIILLSITPMAGARTWRHVAYEHVPSFAVNAADFNMTNMFTSGRQGRRMLTAYRTVRERYAALRQRRTEQAWLLPSQRAYGQMFGEHPSRPTIVGQPLHVLGTYSPAKKSGRFGRLTGTYLRKTREDKAVGKRTMMPGRAKQIGPHEQLFNQVPKHYGR